MTQRANERTWQPQEINNIRIFRTITDCNNCNYAPLYNENIQDKIHRGISKEETVSHNITSDAHNVTVDTFSQTSNTQRDSENIILKSDKLDKLDALV